MPIEMIPTAAIVDVKRAFEQCQRRYPTIQLPFEDYLAHAEGIIAGLLGVPPEGMPNCGTWQVAFAQLHQEDLFLALACARGDRIAWEYFADDYLPMIQRWALHACRSLNEGEDLAQEVVTRLMADKNKLAGYNGRASLSGWLRVAISNAAIDRFRRTKRNIPLDEVEESQDGVGSITKQGTQPVEDGGDARWGPVLSKVLAEEIRRLPPRDRLVLGLYYLQAVPLKAIARQFKVHEATASRWLDGLRKGIRRRIEKELRGRHGLSPREIQSLWHWISEEEQFSIQEALQK
ncbi:MAG TPA: RNA polymerase sigma factor [Acidobacteriota bacterium]|nr:RNA polymerase sigma factor [Acidobacteriota bacterium]